MEDFKYEILNLQTIEEDAAVNHSPFVATTPVFGPSSIITITNNPPFGR